MLAALSRKTFAYRLASVQEQRLPCASGAPDGQLSPSADETPPVTPTSGGQHGKVSHQEHLNNCT